jgi:protein-tyrosine phosphatase
VTTADGSGADGAAGWRARIHRVRTRLNGPGPRTTWLSWIPGERIAIGAVPTGATIGTLAAEGVTHVVNCRARFETLLAHDLALERALFGRARVHHAPMFDTGWRKPPRQWSAAAWFVARVLDEDDTAAVLVHCRAGVHRSVLVTYAALQLRGHPAADAAALILANRAEAELLPTYRASVDDWLSTRPGRPASGAR